MAKRNANFENGHQDGRAGFMQHAGNRDYVHGYRYGRQEYDYWNPPSVSNEEAPGGSQSRSEANELGIGSIVGFVLVWTLIWAPIGFFFGGESVVFNVVFWGGLIFLAVLFVCWLVGLFIDDTEKHKQGRKK